MNLNLIKQISILSFILGLALGIIVVIPLIGLIAFLTLMTVVGAIGLIYLKRNNLIGVLLPKDGALYGAVIGFVSCIGFCCSMIPLAGILALINHLWLHWSVWYIAIGMFFTSGLGGIFVMLLMVFFVGLLSALMNAFSGLVTIYLYDQIQNRDDVNETFHIDN